MVWGTEPRHMIAFVPRHIDFPPFPRSPLPALLYRPNRHFLHVGRHAETIFAEVPAHWKLAVTNISIRSTSIIEKEH